jgi:DNA/RNA non-specific endonuclease
VLVAKSSIVEGWFFSADRVPPQPQVQWEATFFEKEDFGGRSLKLNGEFENCYTFNNTELCDGKSHNCTSAVGKVSAMNNYGNCFVLYTEDNCKGAPKRVVDFGSECHGWWNRDSEKCNLNGQKVRSFVSCSRKDVLLHCKDRNVLVQHEDAERIRTRLQIALALASGTLVQSVIGKYKNQVIFHDEVKKRAALPAPAPPARPPPPPPQPLPTDHVGYTTLGEAVQITWKNIGGVEVQSEISVSLIGPRTGGRTSFTKSAMQKRKMAEMQELQGDEQGHALGSQLGGPAEIWNLFPQSVASNHGNWLTTETYLKDFLNGHVCNAVIWHLSIEYDPPSLRPRALTLNAELFRPDGKRVEAFFLTCFNDHRPGCLKAAFPSQVS